MFFLGLMLGVAVVAVVLFLREIDRPASAESIGTMFRAVGGTSPSEMEARAAARAAPYQRQENRRRRLEQERLTRQEAREAEVLDFILRGDASCAEAASHELVEMRIRVLKGEGPDTLDGVCEAVNDIARRERESRTAMIELAKATYGDGLVTTVVRRELGETA